MSQKPIQLIISINIHEKVNFLFKQLDNIALFVKLNYIIILNCNTFMYNKLIHNDKIKNDYTSVIINKDYFNKRRFHGSLTKGIYSNMLYALENYQFEYFIVLSSRNMFYNELNNNNYKLIDKVCGFEYHTINKKKWHWPSFLKTKLSKYIIDKKKLFSAVAHEGLTFDYKGCEIIKEFLENNIEIRDELFNWNSCVEEFALQTICCNNIKYYYIGTGSQTNYNNIINLSKVRFVCKTIRK